MSSWHNREEAAHDGGSYANVPTSPHTADPLTARNLQPNPAINQTYGARPSSYVPSPLNPNIPQPSGNRSRPVSWGGDKLTDVGSANSGGSGHSSSSSGEREKEKERDTIRGIISGAVGGSFGPYSPLRASLSMPNPPHNRFSTLSSVGSVISLTSDSKYPSLYFPNSNTAGGFLPYSDNPHIDYASPHADPDDALHDPEQRYKEKHPFFNWRGLLNIAFVFGVICALVLLFAGYPVISYFTREHTVLTVGNGVNATGQVADLPNMPSLIDPETPDSVKTRMGHDGQEYELVFSDEFNTDGRSFYPGDDPFWEAVDLNYWATRDLEWYDPSQVTTKDGALVITMIAEQNHDLPYKSAMLQSWNKICFSGGYVEVAVQFPGGPGAMGYWPGAWTMGNLGRPGYGGSTDGIWPYSYDSCDVGTYPNQTRSLGDPPLASTSGKSKVNGALSYLAGQKLSACTCPGDDHPGPMVDGRFVGRGAPEIDIFEAEKDKNGPGGVTSQSAQFAPFSAEYLYDAQYTTIFDSSRTIPNDFQGSATQQSISSLTNINDNWFQNNNPEFAVYGVEFVPNKEHRDQAQITWVSGGVPSWQLRAPAAGPDPSVEIGQRLVSEEPMAIVLNLAISEGYQTVDPSTLTFPALLKFDYVRVYQRKGELNIGCDPEDRPTAQYIQDHLPAFINPNYTTWAQSGYQFPRNQLKDGGC
ncbi:hypothetical protein FRC02_004689 [Tulasnella sp. 418]|nr:hypothetical protein FRC02_004689 [Tulasnella sp. 418]